MKALNQAGRTVLDVLLPPQCFCCGARVADPARLCAACFSDSQFITEPLCHSCGLPFDFEAGEGRQCALCLAQPPAFDHARAAVRYAEPLRTALLAFKHGDRLDMAPGLAVLLQRAGRELLASADLIAPVPLHPKRLWRRRFNQSAVLSKELASLSSVALEPDLIRRQRATRSQGGLSAVARRRNVRGAFRLDPQQVNAAQGRHILLIDDVYTTGATAEACARILKRHGAASASVLTVARVVRPGRL